MKHSDLSKREGALSKGHTKIDLHRTLWIFLRAGVSEVNCERRRIPLVVEGDWFDIHTFGCLHQEDCAGVVDEGVLKWERKVLKHRCEGGEVACLLHRKDVLGKTEK